MNKKVNSDLFYRNKEQRVRKKKGKRWKKCDNWVKTRRRANNEHWKRKNLHWLIKNNEEYRYNEKKWAHKKNTQDN